MPISARVMSTTNGFLARLDRAEEDIKELRYHKADLDDVQRLTEEFKSLRRSLQWFMGLVTSSILIGLTIILQQVIQ